MTIININMLSKAGFIFINPKNTCTMIFPEQDIEFHIASQIKKLQKEKVKIVTQNELMFRLVNSSMEAVTVRCCQYTLPNAARFRESLEYIESATKKYFITGKHDLLVETLETFLNKETKKRLENVTENTKIDARLLLVSRFIKEHYNQPISLYDLSKLIDCNPVYLCNTFSKVFNKSPIKYLNDIRLRQAEKMLLETDLSIKEVATKVGYVSSSHFCQMFKSQFRTTPKLYRMVNKYN
ncbi:helix-turn-helix transcriptional regulator [Paenibacillus hubeiensis]|uniref:helix-turn-helix transcriptional regulator n=1 Tax=Paenibacillus hubeiensis TaxID=3077330 RepID=UPI0031BB9DD3